jgi:DNA (cytosine-5)-methyltransferase 1
VATKKNEENGSARRKWRGKIEAADVFCGVGGLTRGLEKAGIEVKVGVDIDPACQYPYTSNNSAKFILKSVVRTSASDLRLRRKPRTRRLLAGCAPCQPFSSYHQQADTSDRRWYLLKHFERLAGECDPDIITMENVPNLVRELVFKRFVKRIEKLGYYVSHEVVDCSDFGVPQTRRRLVFLASKLGPITLERSKRKRSPKTVKQAISRLPVIKADEVHKSDALHQASGLSRLNMKRIKASKPGGTWRDWNAALVANCHTKKTGKTYPGVYGRMAWNEPAPTITTQFFGFGNGRFGHPEQHRGISLREGAILQSFARRYKFVAPGKRISRSAIGRLIGNAVPVKLGEAIGRTVVAHCAKYGKRRNGSRS